jgi:short-subunit dehydrogenase
MPAMPLPAPAADTTALVTGASSGLGEAMAWRLAKRGHGLTLVARNEERLQAISEELCSDCGVRADVVVCDITDPAARDRLAAEIERLGVHVDVLINNAGFGTYKPFVETPRERVLEEVRVNTEAVADLTARWLPAMVARGRGAVLVTASTAAFQPLPGNAIYAAAKSFALSFAEALHHEVREQGVTVTALCPGPMKTGFQDASGAHEFAAGLPKPLWRTADQVAEAAIEGLERGRRVVIPGAANRALSTVGRVVPRTAVMRVMDST